MKLNNKIKRNSSGVIIPIVVVFSLALIPMLGLAADFSYSGIVRSSLERAVDSAARAGKQGYLRYGYDPGLAVNEAARVFKMNIANTVVPGTFYSSTGTNTPTTLTYTNTFTTADGISGIFNSSSIALTVTTDLTLKTITVTGSLTQMSFFTNSDTPTITVSRKETGLTGTPKDIVLLVDVSQQNKLQTIMTYIGMGSRIATGSMNMADNYDDLIFYQSQADLMSMSFTANGYDIMDQALTDVVINTPDTDIPTSATYTTGKAVYVNDSSRGWVTNNATSNSGLSRQTLAGYRVSELASLSVSTQDKELATTYNNNRGTSSQVASYFNQASSHIEPFGSVTYGIMAFTNTLTSSSHSLALVTYESSSTSYSRTINDTDSDLQGSNAGKFLTITIPFYTLTTTFSNIVNNITISATSGTGSSMSDPLIVNSYPPGNTADIDSGLLAAQSVLSASTNAKVIVLYAGAVPSHTWAALGSTVASLVSSDIKVYSVILTSNLTSSDITDFTTQIEGNGGQTIQFVSDPAALDDAFTTVANDLLTT